MAIEWETLKSQYLQSDRAMQLESLVLNLRRLQVLARSGTDGTDGGMVQDILGQHLVRESQFFIEWIVEELNIDLELQFAVDLVDLQRLLSCWKLEWENLWGCENTRREIAEIVEGWCDRLRFMA